MSSSSQRSRVRHDRRVARRTFLATGLAALSASVLDGPWNHLHAQVSRRSAKQLRIAKIERTTLKVPFRKVPGRNMAREIPHWQYTEICEVHLASGVVGVGETLLFYTWGATREADVFRAIGKNAAELMWDDTLGAGLQQACFDAVARSIEAPIHALLGTQVHRRTPLSWWNIDTSVDDMVAECKLAREQGYTAYKTKGRPWFDLWAQLDAVAKELPAEFKIDMDFNDTLLDAERAIPILRQMEKYPQIDIYETPIFQTDIAGNQQIRQATRVPIAMHYGTPEPIVALREQVCDGFVVGGGARKALQAGILASSAEMPIWMQLVGTGLTAAFSLHFGGALEAATWPAVNCHQLYEHTLLTKPIEVQDGLAAVPDTPGRGYELDRDAMERYRVAKPKGRPEPERLVEVSWPDGRKLYLANTGEVNFVLKYAQQGKMPYFERGAHTQLVPDDGSNDWRDLYSRARQQPVMTGG